MNQKQPTSLASQRDSGLPATNDQEDTMTLARDEADVATESNEAAAEAAELAAQTSEISMLKNRARLMGITFSNNISLDKLRERVDARMQDKPDVPESTVVNPLDDTTQKVGTTVPVVKPDLRQWMHDTEMKLIRLRITNLDPKKKDLPGEIITIANRYLGTVRKYIPYGEVTDDGWHVPYCIYRILLERQFLNIRTTRGQRGEQIQVNQGWVREFALEILDPLTPKEMHQLAVTQAAAGSISTNE